MSAPGQMPPSPTKPFSAETPLTVRAIVPIIGAYVVFALLDTSAKYAGRHLPVLEVSFFRYLLNFLLAAAILNPVSAPTAWKISRPTLQVLRALMLAVMTVANFSAMRYLQLAQTVSIGFLSPLVITILSVIFLKERIGIHRVGAILLGFCGVLIVTRPGTGSFHPAMLLAMLSMLAGAIYSLLTRHLAHSESPGSMVLSLAGIPTLLMAPVLPFIWQSPDSPGLWFLLAFIGAAGGFGHFLVLLAHRHASAARLAPFSYTQLVWMIFTGYVVFGDIPDSWTLLGAGVVIVSGLYTLHRERVTRLAADRSAFQPASE